MEDYYATTKLIQVELSDFYLKTNKKLNFISALIKLYQKGECLDSLPQITHCSISSVLTDDAFSELLDQMPVHVSPFIGKSADHHIFESDILPNDHDVFVYKHFNFINDTIHSHNYFELCYVYKGNCSLRFEKELLTLNEGELCIISPMSNHEISVDDHSSIVLTIAIRRSTLDTAFFSLISQRDLLSSFFRTLLSEQSSSNYLLFYTDNTDEIKLILKNLFVENHTADSYSNIGCSSWINLLFSNLLRNYNKTMNFYNYSLISDFSLVLQYIQHNYKDLKLKDLATLFNYNESHLSCLINQNTGSTFTDLVTNLKMNDSISYLKNTDLSIAEISELIGYHSADHFSRTFKKKYMYSPQQYRKLYYEHKIEH
ncbi:MAG: AraC family transcriptional regulator [Lachnospiraceae bacterium]